MAQSTYTQYYSNFIGTDMSSDPRVVARNRLAYSVNMWRDYESEQGAAVETFPGFRKVKSMRQGANDTYDICGLWYFKGQTEEWLVIQKYDAIYALNLSNLGDDTEPIYTGVNPDGVTSFTINNNLYLVSPQNGTGYYTAHLVVIKEYGGKITAKKVVNYYVPTTYYNGKPYEQRNALSGEVKQINANGGMKEEYENSYKVNGSDATETITVLAFQLMEPAERISYVMVGSKELTAKAQGDKFLETNYIVTYRYEGTTGSGTLKPSVVYIPASAVEREGGVFERVEIEYDADPTRFNKISNLSNFSSGNVTMGEAILNCTKSAVYDGRVFLTGNPDFPNTVFYSHRNLTGANDPTYFGVYNYFNDGDGNTPNVDLLSTPSMLMVLKSNTAQDGSIYYHVGADNPHSDESVRDLVPRVYPSMQGASGLGSAGKTWSRPLSCNFLDDPVFLSQRGGLEGVSKEQLNSERTIVHRSSNIDRLLKKEDLARASITEWKGYLVICCNGHIYLADSRSITRHPDGSYQYEWFYLEGVGTYEEYGQTFQKMTSWPIVDGESLEDKFAGKGITLWDEEGIITGVPDQDSPIGSFEGIYIQRIDNFDVYTYDVYEYYEKISSKLLDIVDNSKIGLGDFYVAKHVITVGDLLIFATKFDICVFNTDKRGKNIKGKDANGKDVVIRYVDDDKIDSSWYTFNGVPYKSACALKLDDCDKKSLTKTTIYGTTVARLKMIPGSKCKIKSSVNGRDWIDVAEAYNTRQDFDDIRFDNLSFTENEDNVVVIPEVSRGWMQKQYYFESNGFCEPFGLYELSYIYKIAGKLRYV